MTKIEDTIKHIITVLSQEEEVSYRDYSEIIDKLTDDEQNCEEILAGNVQKAIDVVWNNVGNVYMSDVMIDVNVHDLAYYLLSDHWSDIRTILEENGITVIE